MREIYVVIDEAKINRTLQSYCDFLRLPIEGQL